MVTSFWLLVFYFLLATSYLLPVANPVYAQAQPQSLPCEQPVVPGEEILTHHWLADENRQPPSSLHRQTITVIGAPGASVNVSQPIAFTVDFSKLGALFGPTNSNYLEGKFQDQDHKSADIAELEQTEISTYHGSGQKAAPQVMLDLQRLKYISYIWERSHLPEASDQIADTNGDNPKRIFDMVNDYQMPDSLPETSNPTPPSLGGNKFDWQTGWGNYWGKIPTTYDEFYEAYIGFREESNSSGGHIERVLEGDYCPDWLPQEITIVIPKYFRTTTASGQLNQIMVPKAAQSHHSNDLILNNKDDAFLDQYRSSQGLLGKIIDSCIRAFKQNPVSNALRNVIGYLMNAIPQIANQTVYAQDNQSSPADSNNCMRVLIDGKEGQDPYCAFNPDLGQNSALDYSCQNQIDENKLDTDNENVICTFQINWEPKHNPMIIGDVGPGENQWDECVLIPDTGQYRCSVEVSIWPVFKIPWTTELWNNTLFSDTENKEPFIGSDEFQKFGRPGVYSYFTPNVIFNDKETEEKIEALQTLVDTCLRDSEDRPAPLDPNNQSTWPQSCLDMVNFAESADPAIYPGFQECVFPGPQPFLVYLNCAEQFFTDVIEELERKKPGENDRESSDDLSRRFIGGTDCSKEYVWHNALYPIAAQKTFGIQNDCPVNAASNSRDPVPPGGAGGDCSENSRFASLLPNPIPQSAGASSPINFADLEAEIVEAAKLAEAETGVACELLIGLHFVESNWNNNGSFISGRELGTVETDVPPTASACTAYGGTIAAGGCIFSSLSDTAIYAGDHIKDKVAALTGAWRPPQNFGELVGAMSLYNGGGNANCGEPVPYTGPCPPPVGIDDPYAVNYFDDLHDQMYLIFCADLTRCDPPQLFTRYGAATVAKEFYIQQTN